MNWKAIADIFNALALLAVAIGSLYTSHAVKQVTEMQAALKQEIGRSTLIQMLNKTTCVCDKEVCKCTSEK